jgi:hypothetical protein
LRLGRVCAIGYDTSSAKAKQISKIRWGEVLRLPKFLAVKLLLFLVTALSPSTSSAWFDETHLAIAKVAGYQKWFNAAGPDVAKLKMGDKEGYNHFVNNPKGTVVTPEMILAQVERYNQKDPVGHLYGAIIASIRDYIEAKRRGRYAATWPTAPITSGICHNPCTPHYGLKHTKLSTVQS